jgi:uncharacterized protein YuzE
MQVAIQPDTDNDSLYLAFGTEGLAGASVARSVRATEDVTLDFDMDGHLVGLDVMNASNILMQDYANIRLDALIGVKQASALLGLQKSNFVRDLANRDVFPGPVAELATGRVWLRSQVEAFAASRKQDGKAQARKAS